MKMSKLGSVLAAVLVLSTSAVCAQTTFKLGHPRPLNTPTDVDMQAFAAEVAKGTSGRVTIKIFPASQLGNYTVVQERVGMGDVEMQLAPVGTNVTKGLGIVTAPYMVETFEQIPVVFEHKGKMMAAVNQMFEKEGIKVLGMYPKYFGGVALSKMPNDPKGTGNKGMKIRVPGIKSFEKTAEAMGYQATPIAFSEAFTSWQTGIVDGAIGSGAEGYWGSFKDLTKVYLPTNSHLEMWFLYVSIDAFKKLSPADQKVLIDAALTMEKARYAVAAKETAEYENLLEKNGTQVVKFTPAELKAMADTVKAKVWPQIKGDYGVALFDSITAK